MEKMKFEEFTNEVVEKIREFLPESFATANVKLNVVRKNNNIQLTGLSIESVEKNICPTIYLEKFYEDYENGEEMGEILSRIASVRMNHELSEKFDVTQITNFEEAKKRLIPRLVNADMNKELLEERPHKLVADLAITYYILLDKSFDGNASAAVTNDIMKIWNVSLEEVHEVAISNLPELLPSTLTEMMEVLAGMIGKDKEDVKEMVAGEDEREMYVLTNKTKANGATALLDENMMKEIVDKFGKFYILPSSIHEVIIVPSDTDCYVDTFQDIVCEVNDTTVKLEERLSDHVYSYSLEKGLYLVK